ncbi:PD-(D/E)XK nuclease family protein [Phycicoccus sp.]|uniref:PD-(D/E)XK nuclease family protein n=1 Tax=Phycicoccus sp. TaxID=1902410 RepID=UPI002D14E1F5|nr:PD-(D/E)XK nuclease family protein [Phycicoccus sp.]HMM94183.1 PD-(D/E)XK nuclease family protein [Phycicoccus sp.]
MLVLRRPATVSAAEPVLDTAQRAAVDADAAVVRVLGAPGTGTSTVAVERVVRAVREGAPADSCLLLAPTRLAAARLRDVVTARLGGTTTTPLARTHQSFGFGLLREAAALVGDPAPRLLSGPEQDVILRELLAGHADGTAPAPPWPASVTAALPTRGFRSELRDLLMRALELGLRPADLDALGREHGVPEWVAGAVVLGEYEDVTALSAPGAWDPATVLTAAADLLEEDPDALDRLRARLRLVVVDDAQELTPAGVRLLDLVTRGSGIPLLLAGDPDAATQTFRGADPRLVVTGWPDAAEHVLRTGHRSNAVVAAAAARVVGHVGVVGGGAHRSPTPAPGDGGVEAHLLRTGAQEAAFVAGTLREAHLLHDVPWSRMAVVVRGGSRTATLRRVLRSAGVPVDTATADLPVRDEPAVRPLLALLGCALDVAAGADALDPEVVVDVLGSPVGGADAVALRRLRRSLRRLELDAGGGRPSDLLLAESVLTPAALDHVGPEARAARRVHRVLAAAVDALRDGRGVEEVLWAMWSASGLAEPWRETALAGGPAGQRADRDLDAVLGLFDAAARYVDRLPGARPADFLEHLLGQDVAGDTLAARAAPGESVALLTPAAAAGLGWDLVVVAGVQEGAWPDLRLRGSLLRSTDLVDVVTGRAAGPRAARTQVAHDETRLFHVAVTRARSRLVVTAVRSEDEQPSPYLDVVDPRPDARPFTDVPRPLTLPGLVGELRRSLLDPDPAVRGAAVTTLGRLARAGVPGADPAQWWALRATTDDRPRRAPDAPVRVSPSMIDRFGQCGLQWLLRASGGDGPSMGAQDIGTLVHEVAHDLGDVDAAAYAAELEARWGRLGLPPGWLSRRDLGRAREMTARLATYHREASAEGWRRAASEERMRVALGRAVVAGTVDRIEIGPEGAVRVIDLKTGSRKPTKDELARNGQLGAYQLAVEEGAFAAHGTGSGGAALLQLGRAANRTTTLQVQAPLAADPDPAWARELVERTAEGMAAASFRATPGRDVCGTCQVKDSCPAQPEGRRL